MRQPLVSVIVTTYNQEQTIARTLNSIVSQQCDFDYEIIIGEDCSHDNTLAICREYASLFPDKIRLIENQHNKGMIDNYFDCVLVANGKYIADCAGDDYWVDDLKLQKQADIMESDSSITLVHSDWRYADCLTGKISNPDPNGQRKKYHTPIIDGRELIIPLLQRIHSPIIHLCTAMYRKSAFEKEYFNDTSLFRDNSYKCEDVQITTTLAMNGKIAYIPDVTLHYTVGHISISNPKQAKKTVDFYIGTTRLLMRIAQKYSIPRSAIIRHYANRIHYTLSIAFDEKDIEMRNSVLECAKELNIPLTTKSQIIRLISHIPFLWDMSVKLKKLHHTWLRK